MRCRVELRGAFDHFGDNNEMVKCFDQFAEIRNMAATTRHAKVQRRPKRSEGGIQFKRKMLGRRCAEPQCVHVDIIASPTLDNAKTIVKDTHVPVKREPVRQYVEHPT